MFGTRVVNLSKLDDTGAVAPTQSLSFITKEEVKAALSIAGTAEDAFLDTIIPVVCEGMEKYLDRPILWRQVSEIVRSHPVGNLVLTHAPVNALVSVTNTTNSKALVADTDFAAQLDNGVLIDLTIEDDVVDFWSTPRSMAGTASAFKGNLAVVYKAGWKLSEIPAALKKGAIEWTKALRFERRRDPAIAREAVPDVGETEFVWGSTWADQAQSVATGQHGGQVPITVAALINPYRRKV